MPCKRNCVSYVSARGFRIGPEALGCRHEQSTGRPSPDPADRRMALRRFGRRHLHRRHRSRPADAVPHRHAGAATLAAVGLAAADLWELRTGRRQQVAVDARQATASLRSGTYMKIGDGALSHRAQHGSWASIPPRTAAGATSTATSRTIAPPRSRCSACRKIARRCAKAVAKWDALELEEAIIAAKGAGGMVRSTDEWAQHPQAARHRLAAADGDRQDRRQPARAAARRRPAAVGHPRARPDARPGRADLRAHARRARRRRAEDHRRATCRTSATRNTTPATASSPRSSTCASRRTSRRCAGWSARPTSSRRATGRARSATRGLSPEELAALRPGIVYRLAVRVQPCRAVGVAPRLRHGGADGQRHHGAPGRALPRQGSPARSSIRCRRSTT